MAVRYCEGAAHFRHALDWYRENVNPNGDAQDLCAYAFRVAMEAGHPERMEAEGLGLIHCFSREGMKAAPFARIHAMTLRGFVVELPTMDRFEEDNLSTAIA